MKNENDANDKNGWNFLNRHFFFFKYSNVEQYCLTAWQQIYHEINNTIHNKIDVNVTTTKRFSHKLKKNLWKKYKTQNVYSNQKCLNEFFRLKSNFLSIDMNHQEHLHRISELHMCVHYNKIGFHHSVLSIRIHISFIRQ